jgi:hypothetical protein
VGVGSGFTPIHPRISHAIVSGAVIERITGGMRIVTGMARSGRPKRSGRPFVSANRKPFEIGTTRERRTPSTGLLPVIST